MDNKKYAIAMIKYNKEYYVMSSEQGEITTRDTAKEMQLEYSAINMQYMRRGGGAATAAVLHNGTFEPRFLEMTLKDMGEKLFDLKTGIKVYNVRADYGGFKGLKCNSSKNLEDIFNSGLEPNLNLR
jgi:hypothetical protein